MRLRLLRRRFPKHRSLRQSDLERAYQHLERARELQDRATVTIVGSSVLFGR